MKISFYERFIELCKLNGIKPTPALKDIGLSAGNLPKWQRAEATITIDTLEKIAGYFGVSPTYFFDEDTRGTEKAKAELENLILNEISDIQTLAAQCEKNLNRLEKIYNDLRKAR